MDSQLPEVRTPVILNVYDLEDDSRPLWIKNLNWYLYSMGLGVYHSAIEVNGREYAFGGHDLPGTGVFSNPPREADGAIFRQAIPLGYTRFNPEEVESVIAELAIEYTGVSYNLFSRNCNNFADDLGKKLSGHGSPLWVNRLASYAEQLKAWMPEGMDSPHLAPVQGPRLEAPGQTYSSSDDDDQTAAVRVPGPMTK